jgi:hypothetical protein
MKQTALKRRTPLRSGGPIKAGAKRRDNGRGPERSAKHLAMVRTFSCLGCGRHGPSEAHHFGKRGKGQKSSDFETVPLCTMCHREWHSNGLPGGTRAEWLERFRQFASKFGSKQLF